MKYIDLHCDTLMEAFIQRKEDFCSMPGHIDVQRMKDAGQLAQFFAIFMPPPGEERRMKRTAPIDDAEYIETCINVFANTMTRCSENIAPALSAEDILANERDGKVSALLSLEDGRAVNGSMEKLEVFYQSGLRMIGLTWNGENCFGYPNSVDPKTMEKGLTDFGKDAVLRMQEMGMLIDVSHLSDGGFYDVAMLSTKPFMASHSNSRSLSPHSRNLTDEMLRILADKGGVAGVNFCPYFLHSDTSRHDSTLEGICMQVHQMIRIGGEDCVALGSDFDGIEGDLEIAQPSDIQRIFHRLSQEGLSERVIEKIVYKNALRVISDVL